MFRFRYRRGNAVIARCPMNIRTVFADAMQELGGASPLRRAITVTLLEVRDWQPWLADAVALLSEGEAGRVQRRRVAADREALALAYALHRLLLGKVLGRDPTDVPLHRDERGCPRLAGDIAYTSLSHADGLIALAVTTSGPLGVDIEPRDRAAVMPEIARSVCHRSEAAELSALDEPARAAALLAIWVRKEALLKAAGIGLAVPMETFAAPEHHSLLMLPALFADPVQVRMLGAGDRCVAAIAGPPGVGIECRWVRPPIDSRVAGPPTRTRPGLDLVRTAVLGRADGLLAFIGIAGTEFRHFTHGWILGSPRVDRGAS